MRVRRTHDARTLLLYLALGLEGCSSCERQKTGTGPLTQGAPIAIPLSHAAYVTNNASDSISVIDRAGDAVTTVPVDVERDAHEAPHHLAVHGAAQRMFVALAFPPEGANEKKKRDPHATHGGSSDLGRLARLDLATLSVRETVDVEENPGDVVLTHDKSRVIVTHFDMKRVMDVAARGAATPATSFAHLTLLDAATMKKIASRAICAAPHGVVTTKDDKTAFVACYGGDEIAIVDLAGGASLATTRVPLGATPGVPGVPRYGPYSVTLTPDESRVVVADLDGKDLRIFERAEKKLVRTIPLDAKAFMPAFAPDGALLVPLQAPDGIARIENEAITKRTTYGKAVCALPHVVRFDAAGGAFLVCEGDHVAPGAVLEIDPVTLAMKRRWVVGAYPDGIAFSND